VQTYKKASVHVFHVRCHVQGLLGQGVAVAVCLKVCKAATREDKAEAAWHAEPSTKSAAVPAKHKAVELHADLHACEVIDRCRLTQKLVIAYQNGDGHILRF
jgi:hypothetical protein